MRKNIYFNFWFRQTLVRCIRRQISPLKFVPTQTTGTTHSTCVSNANDACWLVDVRRNETFRGVNVLEGLPTIRPPSSLVDLFESAVTLP